MLFDKQDQIVQDWIAKHRNEIIEMWLELIRIPSVRGDAAPGAPFGVDCARALDVATQQAQKLGFETRLEADRGYSLARIGNGQKTIGVFTHSDVVPVGAGWTTTDPFSPVIRDGVVYGRGCKDNKNGVVAALIAAKIIMDCGLPLNSSLQVFIGSCEENSMPDMVNFVEHEKMPDLSLVPDSNYPCSMGEKGHLKQWNRCKTELVDILDFHGDGAFNIVLDHAEVILAYNDERYEELKEKIQGKSAFTLRRTEVGNIQLKAQGAAKHSAYPNGSVNAALLICQLLSECETICASDRKQLQTVAELMYGYYGENLGIAFNEAGFGNLTCTNGMVKVEDKLLSISVDIRYGTGMTAQKLEKLLDEAWTAAGWETTYRDNQHGMKVDPESPVIPLLTDLTCRVTGREYTPYWMNGGTYSRHLKNTYTIGSRVTDVNSKTVIPQLPAGHGGAHQRDEFCVIDDFIMGIRLLTHCILGCDSLINQ